MAKSPTRAGQIDDWDRHWSEFGEAAERAPAVKYRRRLIFRLLDLPAPSTPLQMLEIGSGQGRFAKEFCGRMPKARFLGLELSHVAVKIAAEKVPSARFLQRDLLQPVAAGDVPSDFKAEYAVCSEVLEHVEDPPTLLRNASAYLAAGCQFVITVPGGPMGAFDKHIGHRKHYTTRILRQELENAGFRVSRVYAAGFPFFNLYRIGVIIRGENLVNDVTGEPSLLVRAAMAAFDVLFRFNLMRGGYQVLAVATWLDRK